MKTDRIYVDSSGAGREDALSEMERFADYLELSKKSRLHLRLLTEELLGMVSEIGGGFSAGFWAENDGKKCLICLEAEVNKMSTEKREALISVSTSGKNAAVKGVMGKLKNLMELYWLGYKETVEGSTGIDFTGYTGIAMSSMSAPRTSMNWRLSDYRDELERQKDNERIEAWDELEKSIVANIADDISVGIKGENVRFVITKSFD